MGPISPVVRGLMNGFSLGNMLQQQKMDQRRLEMNERQQEFDNQGRQATLLSQLADLGARPVTESDQYEMDGGTAVQFADRLPIEGGPTITSGPTDLPARVLAMPGSGQRFVLPSADERDARAAKVNQRTLLDRNRAEAERQATNQKMQEEATARTLETTGIQLPTDMLKRFGMEAGRKVLPAQMDDLIRADTYRQSVTTPRQKKVVNTGRVLGQNGKLMSVITYDDGSQDMKPINGTVPPRPSAAKGEGRTGETRRKLTPSQEADELAAEVLAQTKSPNIEDAINNAVTYFQNDTRFTPGRRAQVIQRLKTMRDKDPANPLYQQSADAATSGPAVGTVESGYRFKGGDPANQANWEKAQ